ncbi:MAG: hypothetical protein MUP81_03110 [Dehalococcoidia bacterium]|nr:hypothetical protein [Dehalococcoidia bacterium]
MAKGKNRVQYLGGQASISSSYGDWDFIYVASTTKDAKYNIGDRVVLPDGREFTYAKSSGACYSAVGCHFTATGLLGGNMSGAPAIGDRTITIGATTHTAVTADELRGGYIILHYTAGVNYDEQVRGIIGNLASISAAALTVYMDGPLTTAPTAGTLIEVFQNPYAAVIKADSTTLPIAGVPAVYVSAANTYFWVQTRGFTFVAPQDSVVGENGGIGCFWRASGSIESMDTTIAGTVATNDTSQYAGHTVEGTYSGTGPLFYLNGC